VLKNQLLKCRKYWIKWTFLSFYFS
jgi:hypothetical protein